MKTCNICGAEPTLEDHTSGEHFCSDVCFMQNIKDNTEDYLELLKDQLLRAAESKGI